MNGFKKWVKKLQCTLPELLVSLSSSVQELDEDVPLSVYVAYADWKGSSNPIGRHPQCVSRIYPIL